MPLSRILLLICWLSVSWACANSQENSGEPMPVCGSADGVCPAACNFYTDSDCDACDPAIGLTAPVQPCSTASPCTHLLATYPARGITTITDISDVPACRSQWSTTELTGLGCYRGGRGDYDDGPAKSWVDEDGNTRYWCEFRPSGTSPSSRRPLLIYVPGSGGGAGDIYDFTSLRNKAIGFDLSGDPDRSGFILVSSQGRNLHWPTTDAQDGSKHDTYHRNLATNRDAAFFDYLIDHLVNTEGVVDPDRIYLTGWSNGARFAAFYGVYRKKEATAGGNRVAAVAVYSGGDPFENIRANQTPSCKQNPYPITQLPFLNITRNCDVVACDRAQFDSFNQIGWTMTPGNQATRWMDDMVNGMGNPNAAWLLIGGDGSTKTACLGENVCTTALATRNHMCWPDGISDGGGLDREMDLLTFLRAN